MRSATFRAIRQHLGILQCDMAKEIGVTKSALCQFEYGRENAIAPWRILPMADAMRDTLIGVRGTLPQRDLAASGTQVAKTGDGAV